MYVGENFRESYKKYSSDWVMLYFNLKRSVKTRESRINSIRLSD